MEVQILRYLVVDTSTGKVSTVTTILRIYFYYVLTFSFYSMPLMARSARYRSENEVFFSTVNVFLMDFIKFCLCSVIIIVNEGSIARFVRDVKESVFGNPVETMKICVPSLIYTLQNNLYYIALSNLESTTFCVSC